MKAQVQKYIDKKVYGVDESLSDDEDLSYFTTSLNDKEISRSQRRLRRENRCLLHQIFITTYSLQDENLLKQLRQNLQTLLLSLKKCVPQEQCLVDENPPSRKRRNTVYTQTKVRFTVKFDLII